MPRAPSKGKRGWTVCALPKQSHPRWSGSAIPGPEKLLKPSEKRSWSLASQVCCSAPSVRACLRERAVLAHPSVMLQVSSHVPSAQRTHHTHGDTHLCLHTGCPFRSILSLLFKASRCCWCAAWMPWGSRPGVNSWLLLSAGIQSLFDVEPRFTPFLAGGGGKGQAVVPPAGSARPRRLSTRPERWATDGRGEKQRLTQPGFINPCRSRERPRVQPGCRQGSGGRQHPPGFPARGSALTSPLLGEQRPAPAAASRSAKGPGQPRSCAGTRARCPTRSGPPPRGGGRGGGGGKGGGGHRLGTACPEPGS